ncbi:MAG: extracellular solute-binding protein, partial [Hyphomicrobiales bacterium]|nr:extracellular solute-binding protein [Hyphomicrobiales bacterium]
LARAYDLIVIDHPHVGQIVNESCLAPLDPPGRETEAATLAAASVGPSYPSYNWDGRQWALPIDAAAQVQAWRPDRLAGPARTWDDVMALASDGRILCPMRPPHILMILYTLSANLGRPRNAGGRGDLIDAGTGRHVLDLMQALFATQDPECLTMDPIEVLERMSEQKSEIADAPLIYGYVSYAMDGFRDARIAFDDIPIAGTHGPVGSAVGGTGIAVSAFSETPEAAIDFAYWIASGDVQKGPYAAAGGQPGHAAGWEDPAVNAATGDFYANTRATLEGGWLRPRHDGYLPFQEQASARLQQALRLGEDADRVIADLNQAFRKSFR